MATPGVLEIEVSTEAGVGGGHRLVGMLLDVFVLHVTPQALH